MTDHAIHRKWEAVAEGKRKEILQILQKRFEKYRKRHPTIEWESLQRRLQQSDLHLAALFFMEESGGEPDVIHYDEKKDQYLFVDFAAETPAGRRHVCYDKEARESRRKNASQTSALELASQWGIDLLSPAQYCKLQTLGAFDTRTSSWVKTPDRIRRLGGALFGDRRYDTVFIYHNGAESYYGDRGFRGCLKV